jgi:hypothetical protein
MKRVGMTLYCKCGRVVQIVWAHKWRIDKTYGIQFADKTTCTMISQSCQLRTCLECGAIANLNETTETTVIRH